MVSSELDINISPEAGGIKFFRGSIVKAGKKKKDCFLQNLLFPDLSTAKQWRRGDSH